MSERSTKTGNGHTRVTNSWAHFQRYLKFTFMDDLKRLNFVVFHSGVWVVRRRIYRHCRNRMWFGVICTLIDNDRRHHLSTTNFDLWIVVDKIIDHAKPHFDLSFLPQYERQKNVFFRARAEKGIARHIDASSVVWTLIDNGKLAN